jgi:hypothetical protein
MGVPQQTYRTDEQLEALLGETGDWVVNASDGLIMGSAVASLSEALRTAAMYSAEGQVVRAVRRLPPDGIIVLAGQMERLSKVIAIWEPA